MPMLKELNISVAQGEQVRAFYANYNDDNKYYDEIGNLDYITSVMNRLLHKENLT
jgi:hypothetical protein